MKKIQKKFKLYLFIFVNICLSNSCVAQDEKSKPDSLAEYKFSLMFAAKVKADSIKDYPLQELKIITLKIGTLSDNNEYDSLPILFEKATFWFEKLMLKKGYNHSVYIHYWIVLVRKSSYYSNIGDRNKQIEVLTELKSLVEKKFYLGKKDPYYFSSWNYLYSAYSIAKMDNEAKCAEDSAFVYVNRYEDDFPILLFDKARRLASENKYNEAKEILLQNIKYWEDKKEENFYYYENLMELGKIIANTESQEKAMPYFQKVTDSTGKEFENDDILQTRNLNSTLVNLGDIGDTDEALKISRKLIKQVETTKNTGYIPKIVGFDNHATLLLLTGYIDSSYYYSSKSEALVKKIPNVFEKKYYTVMHNNHKAMWWTVFGDYQKGYDASYENLALIGKDSLSASYFNSYYYETLCNLLFASIKLKKIDLSEKYISKITAAYDKGILQDNSYILSFFSEVSDYYLVKKDLANAEKWYWKAYELEVKIYGKNAIKTLRNKNDISRIRLLQKKYQEALDFGLESENGISKLKKLDNANRPQLYCIIAAYRGLKQPEKAVPFLEKKLVSLQYTFGKTMPIVSEKTRKEQIKSLEDYNGTIYEFAKAYPTYGSTYAYDLALLNKGIVLNYSQNWKKTLENTQDATLKNDFEKWLMCKRFLSRQYQVELSKRSSDTDSIARFAEQLEGNLSRSSKVFQTATATVNWQDVQAKLQEGEAAIEFVDYKYSLETLEGDTVHQYLAILLRKGEQPKVVSLYDEKTIVTKIGKEILEGSKYLNNKALLFDLWQPLEPHLQGIKKIYYSPSGLLNRVSFGAIAYDADKYLSDKYEFRLLRSTRELVVGNDLKNDKNLKHLIIGNIDFGNTDLLAKNKSSDNCLSNFENGESEFLGFIEKAKNANVKYIAKQKKEATEAFVKSVLLSPSPAVMIFSTHGYYEEKPRTNTKNPLQSIKEPLLRTGIMLSDANLAWCGNQTSNDKEDELLTAYEISNMDLSNTQLVVLSACQSGVGDLQGSEGVYGLQRAFKMAGVKNVLCTLWSVDAKVAQSFVDIFYKEILAGKTAYEAFVVAQNNLRKTSTPNLWGAFVLVE